MESAGVKARGSSSGDVWLPTAAPENNRTGYHGWHETGLFKWSGREDY
jgi:hypothetical protein